MSLSSSLNAGVMGLGANATRLATISDNISNSATYGYKRSQVDFSSMVLNQRSTVYSAGGVMANVSRDVSALGSLIGTGNSTDIAIVGRGLLPVTNANGIQSTGQTRDLMLTQTGSFYPDQNGNLRTQSGQFLLGWPTDSAGDIGDVSRNSGTNLEPVNIATSQFVSSPTSQIGLGINLPANATQVGADPAAVYNLPIEYFDNLGRAQNLTLNFSPSVPAAGASNTWQVDIIDNSTGAPVSIGQLEMTFNDQQGTGGTLASVTGTNGATYDPLTGKVSLTLPHGPVEVEIGGPNSNGGLTQLSAEFSPTSITKDGSPIGDLQFVEIDDNGFLQAIYDTGFRRPLYQIPVADVPNTNALQARDGQAFSVSGASGDLYLWDAGSGPVGQVAGYALMESTTDIASELTDLIETQRAYSSNAKIVQTVDEMLQETTNLKR
ncbi:MAG: flagellar hook-basal body complex protein [Henriciella sp.]